MQFCSLLNIPYHVEADRSSGMDANMLGTRVKWVTSPRAKASIELSLTGAVSFDCMVHLSHEAEER